MRNVTTAFRLARAAKKLGVSALLASLVVASTPAYAQSPTPAPSPPAAPSAPPESGTTPPPSTAPPEGYAPPAEPPPPAATPEPMPVPAPPPPAAPSAPEPSKVPSYLFWGLGGASLIVGTVFGALTLSAKSDFDDNPTYHGADVVHQRSVAADVGLGLGVILLASGTIFYFVQDKPVEHAPVAKVRVDPIVSPHTGGGAFTLRF
jgi:hypothetical protein